jgi:hypothetical protein
MEQSLICRYKLDAGRGENTWPAFAKVLKDERNRALGQLNEAIAWRLTVGVTHEQISEQLVIA